MMDVNPIKDADYLIKHTKHEYYTEGDNEKGYFAGRLARFQKLDGKEVDEKNFKRLLSYGEENHGVEFDPGPPKSWSILYNRASPEARAQMDEKWKKAIDKLVEKIEQNTYYRKTENGITTFVKAKAVCVAVFNHHTARGVNGEIDPQEHPHIVVFPKVLGQDGKFYSHTLLDMKYEKNGHETLNYLDQAWQYELSKGLQELGFTTSAGVKNSFVIDGVPTEVCKHFSKRTNQMKEKVGEDASYTERKKALLHMRAPKTSNDLSELRSGWQKIMDAFGFTQDKLEEIKGKQKELGRDLATIQKDTGKNVFSEKELKTFAFAEAKFSSKTYEEKLAEFKSDKNLKSIGKGQYIFASNHALTKLASTVQKHRLKATVQKAKQPTPRPPSKLQQQLQQASGAKTPKGSTPRLAAGAAAQGKTETVQQCISQIKSLEQQLAGLKLDDPSRTQIEAQIGDLKQRMKSLEEAEQNLDAAKVKFMSIGSGAAPGTPGTADFGSLDEMYNTHAKQVSEELDNEKQKPSILNAKLNKLAHSCVETAKQIIADVVHKQQKQKEELTI